MNDGQAREALLAYRLRFSPETQPIKQTFVAHMLLRTIALRGDEHGTSIGNLLRIAIGAGRIIDLDRNVVDTCLRMLETNGNIALVEWKKKRRYRCTPQGKKELAELGALAGGMIDRVARDLFGTDAHLYKTAFMDCLGRIFDELARGYVENLTGTGGSVPFDQTFLNPRITAVASEHHVSDEVLGNGVTRFFQELGPESQWIKLTYCQNAYAARMLGLGKESDQLAQSILSNMSFFLDTNVVVAALDPTSPHQRSVAKVISSFRGHGSLCEVLEITIAELAGLGRRYGTEMTTALAQIPTETLPKVSGLLPRLELLRRRGDGSGADEFVRGLQDGETMLANLLNVTVRKEPFFEDREEHVAIEPIVTALSKHYTAVTGRNKGPDAALHDALALEWLRRNSAFMKNAAYFLTLDRSLGTFRTDGPAGLTRSYALELDALLPWVSMNSSEDAEDYATAYSALLSELLALGKPLRMEDFHILGQLGMDCAAMPAEDVEACVLMLRREVSSGAVKTAEGREQLHHKVKGFLLMPDRKYVAEVATLRERAVAAEAALAGAQ